MTQLVCVCVSLVSLLACDVAVDADGPPGQAAIAPVPDDPTGSFTPGSGSTADEHVAADGYLVSRYAPSMGLPGARVRILYGQAMNGCDAAGECSVTIGGVLAPIADDTYTLEVIVPDDAVTGPLCITWRERSQCLDDFTVLEAPLIGWVSVVPAEGGGVAIDVTGAGFMEGSQVWFDWRRLETTFGGDYQLTAVLPSEMVEQGEHELQVFEPTAGRCGVWSEPWAVTLE